MIEWFDNLSVYLKPLAVMAIVGVFALAVYLFVAIYEKLHLIERVGRRKALKAVFWSVAMLLIYAAMVGLLCLGQ